jgi:hypothetical protein
LIHNPTVVEQLAENGENSGRDSDLAAAAKRNGGDGLLLKAEQTEFLGSYSTGNAVSQL